MSNIAEKFVQSCPYDRPTLMQALKTAIIKLDSLMSTLGNDPARFEAHLGIPELAVPDSDEEYAKMLAAYNGITPEALALLPALERDRLEEVHALHMVGRVRDRFKERAHFTDEESWAFTLADNMGLLQDV